MKKIFLTIAIAFAVGMTVSAQDNNRDQNRPSREEMLKQRTERMAERYGLSAEQSASLLELNKKYADTMMRGMRRGQGGQGGQGFGGQRGGGRDNGNFQEGNRPSREEIEAMMAKARESQEAYEKELKGILTEEQFNKYKEDASREPQRGGGRRGGGQPRQ